MDDSQLVPRLTGLGYAGLFEQPDYSALESVWNDAGAPALAALSLDPGAPALARFLAAEILFREQKEPRLDAQRRQLASVYATALRENFTGTANTWGLPEEFEGEAGPHLLSLGEAALPALTQSLDDERRLHYAGSREATVGHHYGYRVKDLAAWFIAQIRDEPFELDEDPGKRDVAIEKVRTAVT